MNPKYKSVIGYKKVTRYKILDSQKQIKREKILYSSRIPRSFHPYASFGVFDWNKL